MVILLQIIAQLICKRIYVQLIAIVKFIQLQERVFPITDDLQILQLFFN
jgi:hypothetical protein